MTTQSIRKCLYLIGPSGVGKSGCSQHAAKVLNVERGDIDHMCRHRHFHWPTYKSALDRLEEGSARGGVHTIIDIGAGTQCSPELREYLLPRKDIVVLIYAPAEEAIKRNPLGPNRSLSEYIALEYVSRRDLYAVALHTFDVTGKTLEQAQEAFVHFLLRTFPDVALL